MSHFLHAPEPGLVSVVVPVYNGARWLAQAIDSVFGQTYPRIEMIAVDDGSTDASREVLARYPHVQVVDEGHGGVTIARNRGLRHARGELIGFIDQDDIWRPDKLDLQIQLLGRRPEVGCALGLQEIFLEPGFEWPGWIANRVEILSRPHVGYLPGAMLVRRSTFDEIGVFDESFAIGSDADWLVRARDLGVQLTSVDATVLDKRIHYGNLSHDPQTATDMLTVLAASLRRRREAGPPNDTAGSVATPEAPR